MGYKHENQFPHQIKFEWFKTQQFILEKSLEVLASQGTKIVADILIGDAQESAHDLIILPVR